MVPFSAKAYVCFWVVLIRVIPAIEESLKGQECFICHSANRSDCRDPFQAGQDMLGECPYGCWKLRYVGPGKPFWNILESIPTVERGCFWKGPQEASVLTVDTRRCLTDIIPTLGKVTQCSCNSNRCNSAISHGYKEIVINCSFTAIVSILLEIKNYVY
ncbi:hypothetical protein ScPMuIL_008188 [Solemya velum]